MKFFQKPIDKVLTLCYSNLIKQIAIQEVNTMANYTDKITGEKLPNGDISSKLTEMNKELGTIKAVGTENGMSLKDKAHFLAVAKSLTSAIEYYSKLWGGEIAASEETFEFPDLGVKVMGVKGGSLSKIADRIFDELSLEEIKKCASVTEKGLKEIGKADLIQKYKEITGNKANSCQVKTLI